MPNELKPMVCEVNGDYEQGAKSQLQAALEGLSAWARFRHQFREPLAEFLGTTVFILFGDGAVTQLILSKETKNSYNGITLAWGIAVMFGYFVSGGVSGGHLNPSITIAAWVFRGFPGRMVLPYIGAQILGGFIGSLINYGIYVQGINAHEGPGIRTITGSNATAPIFASLPQPYLDVKGAFASELSATALLQIGIFALTDPYNAPAGPIFPLCLCFLIYALGSCFGMQTGYTMNLARDLGPRVAAVAVGYGSEMFKAGNYFAWIPIVAPVVGSLLGGVIYDVFIYQGKESPVNKPWSFRKRQ